MKLKPEKKNKIILFFYYFIRGIILLALAGFLFEKNWSNAVLTGVIFLLMIAPSVLKNKYNIYIPFIFDFVITLFIYLTLFLGSVREFYFRFSWWDDMLHFQSGLLLGVIGFLMAYILNESKTLKLTMSAGFVAFFSFCFSLALANLWEIYEFAADSLFGYNMQRNSLLDTMSDLIVNIIGALIVSIIGYFWMRRSKKLPFIPF